MKNVDQTTVALIEYIANIIFLKLIKTKNNI